MKSAVIGWVLGLGLLASHVGCCSVRMVGGGCDAGLYDSCDCGNAGCGGTVMPFGGIKQRIANRIKGVHCGSGCGEVYWDEHINEPPVCDPCGCGGEFTGDSCGSCPTALGRLRNLWGHRYVPSNCDSCSSGSSGSCSSCSAGHSTAGHSTAGHSTAGHSTVSESMGTTHMHSSSMAAPTMSSSRMAPSDEAVRSQPTPAARPAQPPRSSSQPMPVPDPNASLRIGSSSDRLAIGSGLSSSNQSTASHRTVKVKPASTTVVSPSQTNPGRPRLVTNPR
jgi:hypothetical protein